MKRCLLLSGGIDSIAMGYWQRPELAITIDYGQASAEAEIAASSEVCRVLHIQHDVIKADCSEIGLGNMVARRITKHRRKVSTIAPSPEWWPFRNQLLITIAAARSVACGCKQVIIGTVKSDKQHQDGTRKFVRLMNALLSHQEGGVTFVAPAIAMHSAELVLKSGVPRSILCWAHSCHTGNLPCCNCRGCAKYTEVMRTLRELKHRCCKQC
jgi:7-cyano-7-deazaguanine synthase